MTGMPLPCVAYGERPEPQPCVVCDRRILAGQLYVVAGPKHVYCDPPKRLDLALVEQAARQR